MTSRCMVSDKTPIPKLTEAQWDEVKVYSKSLYWDKMSLLERMRRRFWHRIGCLLGD